MDETFIIACEEGLRTAMLSSDVELLDELIADDLIFVNHLTLDRVAVTLHELI